MDSFQNSDIPWLTLRLTDFKDIPKELLSLMDKYVYVQEGDGEDTKIHCHCNFTTQFHIDTFRRKAKSILKHIYKISTGNQTFSVKQIHDDGYFCYIAKDAITYTSNYLKPEEFQDYKKRSREYIKTKRKKQISIYEHVKLHTNENHTKLDILRILYEHCIGSNQPLPAKILVHKYVDSIYHKLHSFEEYAMFMGFTNPHQW